MTDKGFIRVSPELLHAALRLPDGINVAGAFDGVDKNGDVRLVLQSAQFRFTDLLDLTDRIRYHQDEEGTWVSYFQRKA